MSQGHTDRLNTALGGDYRIERKLGEGGMASVYLAEDVKHQRKVALKILRPELAAVIGGERFLAEIRTTANLQHPHILPLFDSGEADGYLFYVMPFIDGETLGDKLDREKQLGVEEAIRIARDVGDALDYAHRNDVIHRDIKPANILLHDGRPVVADFGIALAVSAAGGGRMTETGLSLGTPHYMSPEQASADRDLSARSDVYSLGCVLYEMIAGQPPHTGPSAQSILVRILTENARPLSELRHTVPPNVAAAVAKSIEKLPADRFESARAFVEALDDADFAYSPTISSTKPAGEASVHTARAPTPRPRVALLPWAAATVLGIVAVAALLRPEPTTPVQRFWLELDDLSGTGGPAVAIAPDGSTIAYVGEDRQLYWRSISALEAQVVPGSEDSRSPFFSPDGRTIGYTVGPQSDDRIRTISLDGAPPRTLSGDHYPGAAWGDDGFVYYSNIQGDLFRVSEQGGDPEVLSEAAESEYSLSFPVPLPGGESILIRAASSSGVAIANFDLESREVRPIIDAGFARYANRHVFWVNSEGTLFAAPFDPEIGDLTAAGVELADGVRGAGLGDTRFFAIAENGTLVYGTGEQVDIGSESFAWVTEGGSITAIDSSLDSELGDIDNLALSPDGRFIAIELAELSGAEGDQAAQIWIYDLDQRSLTRLTFRGTRNRQPRWMPDGRTVAYLSDQGGDTTAIWGQPFDRSGDDELMIQLDRSILGYDAPPAEGLPFVVSSFAPQVRSPGLFTAHRGDAVPAEFLVSEFRDWRPRISPDGQWVLYESNETGTEEIYVRAYPDGGRPWAISRGGGRHAIWGTTADEIFFENSEGQLVRASLSFASEIRVQETIPLFSTLGLETSGRGRHSSSYDVSSDGEQLLMILLEGSEQATAGRVALVLNVFDELRERTGN
jgi:serine/threonine-protein kinase